MSVERTEKVAERTHFAPLKSSTTVVAVLRNTVGSFVSIVNSTSTYLMCRLRRKFAFQLAISKISSMRDTRSISIKFSTSLEVSHKAFSEQQPYSG
uniref:Secreted protein n=1 Tax=Parascaris univalens TaxID=6257 RepID=A0A915A3N3_PARUN